MSIVNKLTEKVFEYFKYRDVVKELSSMTDRELCDIGISRCDIPCIAKEASKNG
jgi:uncharacterized protein YjiS (DUF1127 family)